MRLLHFMHTGESSKNMRKIQFPRLKLLMISGLLQCFVAGTEELVKQGEWENCPAGETKTAQCSGAAVCITISRADQTKGRLDR
jgi:hypothetical protein